MGKRYVCEKLAVAMDAMAVSSSSIQTRLANAALSALVRLSPDDFDDDEEQALYVSIMERLQSKPAGSGHGRIEASAEALSDDEAVAVARDIADLHGRVLPVW